MRSSSQPETNSEWPSRAGARHDIAAAHGDRSLDDCESPLLAVWGENDPFFLPPCAEAFRFGPLRLRGFGARVACTGHQSAFGIGSGSSIEAQARAGRILRLQGPHVKKSPLLPGGACDERAFSVPLR